VEALERLLNDVDNRDEIPSLMFAFQRQIRLVEREGVHSQLGRDVRDGYVMLRKLVITPSRMILHSREMIMGNRAVRFTDKHPVDDFLRVVFRDDDGQRIWPNNITQKVGYWLLGCSAPYSQPTMQFQLMLKFVGERLNGTKKFIVGGREFNFIGNSNSQMRDQGCYFLAASVEECNMFRTQLGQFNTRNIPQLMARLGQYFTQAEESSVATTLWKLVDDYTGGEDSNGDPYIFSDGCGSISMRAAQHIMQSDLKLRFGCMGPSCYQVRGVKRALDIKNIY